MPTVEEVSIPVITDFSSSAEYGTLTTIPDAMGAPALPTEVMEATTIGDLPSMPIYVPPKLLGSVEELMGTPPDTTGAAELADITNLNEMISAGWGYLINDEDTELAGGVNSIIQQIISLYNGALQNQLNIYNESVLEYNQEVQKVLRTSELEQQRKSKQTDLNWQASLGQYQQELAHHQAELARFQADINVVSQKWTLDNLTYKLAKWNQQQGHKFTKFSHEATNELNKFNALDKAYTNNLNIAIKNAELESTSLAATFQQYDKELAQYSADVNSLVQEHTQNEVNKKWERYKFDYVQELARFNAELSSSMNRFNEDNVRLSTEVTLAQANAANIQAALAAKMSADTDLAKDHSAQKMQADIQTFSLALNNWTAQVGVYNHQVQTENTKFGGELQAATTTMTNEMNKFNTEQTKFQAEINVWEKLIGQLRQDYVTALGMSLQPKTQGE